MPQAEVSKKYIAALRKRERHLSNRIRGKAPNTVSYDRLERAALNWVLNRVDPKGEL